MKWHYLIWVTGSIVILFGSVGLSIGEGIAARSIYDDNVYRRTFDDFYSRLENLPGDVLVYEMEEQIESALMRGSRNISPADLQHKIRQVELEVHDRLKGNLCRIDSVGWSKANIELVGIDSVRAALSGYKVNHKGDYARIVSVLVRILEGKEAQFCNSFDFRHLAS